MILPEYLPADIVESKAKKNYITIPIGTALKIAEKNIILQTLSSVNNNKSKAAHMLGLTRKVLYNKLKRFERM